MEIIYHFLIIDDHPMIINGYKTIIQSKFPDAVFHEASNIDDAISLSNSVKNIDFLLLDYNIGKPSNDIENGIDLAKYLASKYTSLKTLIITAHEEIAIVYNIHKKVRPNALLIKSDVNAEELLFAIDNTLKGEIYRSNKAQQALISMNQRTVLLQEDNIQILMLLDKGYKVQEIPSLIHKSLSSVQRNIVLLKEVFNVSENNGLLREAKRQGFI
ncbi:response regulator transcription factor [Myroides marinus]|uniref:response regulator n=1 Tax=Myroides marinus TaxID=703342 RepID=UPI0025773835|nr:response regulator [Myroides marinus]MDM1346898.1 response regulator transcription factor [Myroides marinus]MDM1356056.1 response regulator transcription factor [Myroides marinus]MDM1364622.1 response regulator transcription factor [Myroides marinus]MDM1370856.1 response regulator transcription factor [Myroides marinus]MDM1377928.1 response regulator transcription factor [Myroides marinus]